MESRTALLMGVAKPGSDRFADLPGIDKDLASMSAALKQVGFEVTVVRDPTLAQAEGAIDDFGAKLKVRQGVGLFYFSGHGGEFEGRNYLIPRGARLGDARDIKEQAVAVQRVLNRMESSGARVNIVFLDCCRNDMTKAATETGLAAMSAKGTFIGFATASEKTSSASDEGSPYTKFLVKNLTTPGLSILDMHTQVTAQVQDFTKEAGAEQVPYSYSGLRSAFYFVERGAQLVTRTTPETVVPQKVVEFQTSATPADLPGAGFFDLDVIFSGTPYAGFNHYSKGILLKKAQQKLKDAGFYSGSIDGAMGRVSEQGLLQWQSQKGLAATGRIDRATIASLGLENIAERQPPRAAPAATVTPTTAVERTTIVPTQCDCEGQRACGCVRVHPRPSCFCIHVSHRH